MAANLTKVPLLRTLSTRAYSSCNPATPIGGVKEYELQNTVLPNKLVVASVDNRSPIARISIAFRAGSRNETPENSGVAHVLRICAGMSTANATQFAITRNIQQVGASLTASSNREVITYTLEGTRSAVEKVLPFLTEVATRQVFKPWEVADNVPRLRLELSIRPLQRATSETRLVVAAAQTCLVDARAVDLLHKAAFRQGLGNSLFISKHQLGKIGSETLQHFVNTNFVAGRAAVVGLGVDHRELSNYALNLGLESGEGTSAPSPYKGGEIRSDKGGDIAYVAIGGEGGALKNSKEALAFAVLQHALGSGPKVKWGWADNGPLAKSVGDIGQQYAISALNASYSDTGLFGVVIAAPSKVAGKVVEGAVKTLKSGSVSDADVTRGKNQLKRTILSESEDGLNAIEELAVQAAITGNAMSASQIAAAVDSVSASDVNAALKKVGKKISIASVGNLRTVPFLDELK